MMNDDVQAHSIWYIRNIHTSVVGLLNSEDGGIMQPRNFGSYLLVATA
jgi:hypothetical protein